MDLLSINGRKKLFGDINISGSKNASLPMMIASLLTEEQIILRKIPQLSDVQTLISILDSLGSKINITANSIKLKTKEIINHQAAYKLVKKMRASFWVLGPLIARTGYAEVSLPGGCAIGTRPIDIYLKMLKRMKVNIAIEDGYVIAKTNKEIKSIDFKLEKESVGCTHFFLMLTVLADGTSHLSNAACEPEIIALGKMLNEMGAKIKGLGTKEITVKGVNKLKGVTIEIPPDRIETGTYAIALAATGGEINLKNTRHKEISLLLKLLKKTGVQIKTSTNSIKLKKLDEEIFPVNIDTRPYPGFPTDLQAQIMVLMSKANGTSKIKENIFENRFMHVPELNRMGAKIKILGNTAFIYGPQNLNGAEVMATDLRASVSLVLAGLIAENETFVNRVYHLDRGYEKLENKLRNCRASIFRIKK